MVLSIVSFGVDLHSLVYDNVATGRRAFRYTCPLTGHADTPTMPKMLRLDPTLDTGVCHEKHYDRPP
jgi:hypothetical protein